MADIKYLFKDRLISPKEAAKHQVVVRGDIIHEQNLAYVFETVQEFESYASRFKQGDLVAQAIRQIDAAKKLEKEDHTRVKRRQQEVTSRIQSDLKELADKTGLNINSPELFMRATTDYDPLEGPVFKSAQIFEHPNCTGRSLSVPGWTGFPDLSWQNFNDITSSIRVSGFAILMEHAWFGGTWQWFFGIFGPASYNLDNALNDRVSSAWTI